jgi:hypothetical protein
VRWADEFWGGEWTEKKSLHPAGSKLTEEEE